ncbi:hypothetical protein Pcinc_025430 [Petrolisthes cinctipes]|uniref:WAP domain-containing protein n=1 Tax=Petrolisthes cinctipes TaxID=88211 RepID=A0AAE1FAM4_PETCI|nr:hypothetical protein Pcinc_025430 [Petrolisthes cinctipes]
MERKVQGGMDGEKGGGERSGGMEELPVFSSDKMKAIIMEIVVLVLMLVVATEGQRENTEGRSRTRNGGQRSRFFLGGLGNGVGLSFGFGFNNNNNNNGFGFGSSGCRYWCDTPEGQYYCCENINTPQTFVGVVKPGFCPPVRPVCPRNFRPPQSCSNDGGCGGVDKCCFDRCLSRHVCKPPIGFGR